MFKIRVANLKDVEELSGLFDDYRVFYKKKSDLQAAKDFLTERISKGESVTFVAENEEETLVGFTQLYPLFSSTRLKRLWLLNDLYVAKDYRGNGISKLLIEAAKDLCRKTHGCAVMLETAKSNNIGNSLYPATGFELDVENNYYEWTCLSGSDR